MSDAISSSGDMPSKSNDSSGDSSNDNFDSSTHTRNDTENDTETSTTKSPTTSTSQQDESGVQDESSQQEESSQLEESSQQESSSNPFGKISSSDDNNEATNPEQDDFFPAPKFKFKPRSFLDYANSFADPSSATVTQSASNGLGTSSEPAPGISFVSLDKKDIGQLKLPDNIRMLEEAKAKQAKEKAQAETDGSKANDDLASDSISSSSDSKALMNTAATKQSATSSNGNGTTSQRSGTSSGASASGSGFVLFGQNFTDRVSSQADGFKSSSDLISFSDISNSDAKDKMTDKQPSDVPDSNVSNSTEAKPNDGQGSSTNYFSNCHDGDSFGFFDGNLPERDDDTEPVKGLKRTFEVISGEEDEETVVSVPGTLYVWDSDKSTWIGKGKGNFKLNDSKDTGENRYSRLIVRSLGVHKVLLNARLVAGMNVHLANDTSIRFATVEGLHLFKGKKRMDDLLELINTRIEAMNKRRKAEEESSEAEAV